MRGMQLPLVLALAAFAQSPTPPIGAQCIDCHAEVVASYRKTGKARSLALLREGELEGEGAVDDPATGLRYRFETREGRAFAVEERAADEHGQRERVQEWPVAFAIGSGRQLRSFAVRWGELLALAPIEELRADGQREAQLGSRHRIHPGARFTLPVDRECLSCHTSAAPPRAYLENLVPRDWSPRGIDCDGCHANAQAHAQSARAKQGTPSRAGSLDCERCHGADVARIELPECGSHALALFRERERGAGVQLVDQAPHDRGAGALDGFFGERPSGFCLECHHPHADLSTQGEREFAQAGLARPRGFARRECTQTSEARAGKTCAECHLPTVEPIDAEGLRVHDHTLLGVPPPPAPRAGLLEHASSAGALSIALVDAPANCQRIDDRGLWLLACVEAGRWTQAFAQLEEKPYPASAARGDYWRARGELYERANKPDLAIEACERALACDPAEVPAALRLARLLRGRGKAKEARALVEDCVKRQPQAEDALRLRAEMRAAAQDLAGFVDDLERAFAIAPRVETARVLAQAAGALKDPARAARWKELAQRLELTPR